MSDVCSNVCPYEETCLGHCVKGIKGKPINVNKLEKFVNIWARDNNLKYVYNIEKNNNIKIAIIGSGPSGIECAVELRKLGYDVTIFEKEDKIGGLLTYGIPGFRLPRDITENLTGRIKNLGIHIKLNTELGKDINISTLKNEYKAIYIAIGAGIASTYTLTNEECEGIYKSDYILKEYNAKRLVKNLGNTIIIGGGNVAIDSARAAIRMGATSATIVYRRNKEKMPAREIELEEAIKEGIKIVYNAKVLKANVNAKKIERIECIKTDTSKEEVLDIENSEFTIKADSIIFAIGLNLDKELIENQGIEVVDNLIKVDENCMTNIEGVFSGGDSTQKKATVCMAIENGKKTAIKINEYIIKKV